MTIDLTSAELKIVCVALQARARELRADPDDDLSEGMARRYLEVHRKLIDIIRDAAPIAQRNTNHIDDDGIPIWR